jgi:hypothetical protein
MRNRGSAAFVLQPDDYFIDDEELAALQRCVAHDLSRPKPPKIQIHEEPYVVVASIKLKPRRKK